MKQKMIDFLNVFQAMNKSLVMLLLIVISMLFRTKGYISGDNFVDLLKATVVSYFGVTGVVHFTSMVKDHLASKNAPVAVVGDSGSIPVEEDVESPKAGA
jgi:hypothetical protein